MSRDKLKIFFNKRIQVSGIVSSFGFRKEHISGKIIDTACLKEIRDTNGQVIAKHLWIDKIGLNAKHLDKKVYFEGRVIQYTKYNKKNEPFFDYGITNIVFLKK